MTRHEPKGATHHSNLSPELRPPARRRKDDASAAPAASDAYRWVVVALLFAATTINYVDRQALGILAPTLTRQLHWTERDYGTIVSWFSLTYAFGFLVSGPLLDRIGVKLGLSIAVVAWSLAGMGHALVRTVAGFSLARAMLGASESSVFPGAAKAVTEWFPVRRRALATGIFNAGTSTGAIVTPLIVPLVTLGWGWEAAFWATGALGLLWLLLWVCLYVNPPTVHIGLPEYQKHKHTWTELLRYRQTWVLIIAKGCTDPVWVFYLYWLPKFLDARFEVKLSGVAAPLIVFYLIADGGSVAGGWLSGRLIRNGWDVGHARKVALLVAALTIVPVAAASSATSMWSALAIISLAGAAHQAWAANVFTLSGDMFPKSMVGTATGIGSFAGALAAWAFQRNVGALLERNGHDYRPVFLVSAAAYVMTWLLMHVVAPKFEPIPSEGVVRS